jgi:alanine-glyoxylate transaminase/serine-glyoxylate transaminase/serine-pyruvate transaminase
MVTDDAKHPALLLVDGVSSIGAIDFRMDDWKVDVALTGSQKALSLPTGLGIVCASPKALEAAKYAKSTRVFFDWGDYIKFYKAGSYWPYTPSSQMLYGLRASLDLILKEEGLDNVIARHCRLAEATRCAYILSHNLMCTFFLLRISIVHGIDNPSGAHSLERFRLEDVVDLQIGVLNSMLL